MRETETILTFATQGDEFSYHAVAARAIAGSMHVEIDAKQEFGQVVRASRSEYPGLGVIAISTVAGTVEDSAREIVCVRPSALPPIVARVDVVPKLALIGSASQSVTLEQLNRIKPKAFCLAQKPAWLQTEDFRRENLPWIRKEIRGESTDAIREAVNRDDPNWVAIGPTHAAEPLGGVVIVDQVNPVDSVTSFYVLQRDPRQQILPVDPKKSSARTIISLAHPEGHGEFEKCMELAISDEIGIARFIPFAIGDFTKHNSGLRRGGGLLEVEHDRYDAQVTDFCARVNTLCANDGIEGPFGTKILGRYDWYPEPVIDPGVLIEMAQVQPSPQP